MPSKRGSKKGRGGRGGRGSHHLPNAEPDFGDDFIGECFLNGTLGYTPTHLED